MAERLSKLKPEVPEFCDLVSVVWATSSLMLSFASSKALPSALICVPWLVIEPSVAMMVKSLPAVRVLVRASLMAWFSVLFLPWAPNCKVATVIAAGAPSAAPLALPISRPTKLPSLVFLVSSL